MTAGGIQASMIRFVDNTDTPRPSVVSVCGRWAGALPQRTGGTGRHGWASGSFGGVPPGDASDKAQDRLLQGWQQQGKLCQPGFRLTGYTFRPRLVKNSRRGSLFWSFTPAVSQAALTAMRKTIRTTNDDECRVRTDHAPATSRRSNTWRTTFCTPPPASTQCACAARWPRGTMTCSQA